MCQVLVFSSFMHECTYVCSFRSSVYMFVCVHVCVACIVLWYTVCAFSLVLAMDVNMNVSLLCTVPDTSYLRFYAELPSRLSAEYRAV